ncbi:alpha/beta fold hydrolase [Subtercola sp. YIM 133946]|uniref:alpha/beta fold hydrolase n=1 Tax=Subtercola sp. YIM 133946 TaxID=3118909 RepID=UPI002F9225A9
MTTPREQQQRRDEALGDTDWATPPAGVTASTFEAPSGPLAVWEAGEAGHPRVVLLAGVTGSKEDFFYVFGELVAHGFHVQSYDLAGQYESHRAGPENLSPPRRHYDYDLFTGDLLAFIRSGEAPVHLLGYSFAGIVAELVAADHPDLVASLTLLGSPPTPGQSFRGIKRLGPFSGHAPDRVAAALMRWGVTTNVLHVRPGRLAFVRSRFTYTRRSSHADIMGLMKRVPDVRADLQASGMPIDVAVGEHDLWPTALHAANAEALGGRLHVYRTGHSPCEDAPFELSFDLLDLFERARPAL